MSCEPCHRLDRHSTGEFYCADCDELLCHGCRRDHTKFRKFLDHKLSSHYIPLSEASRDHNKQTESTNPSYRKVRETFENVSLHRTSELVDTEASSTYESFLNDSTTAGFSTFTNVDPEDYPQEKESAYCSISQVTMPEPRFFPVFEVLQNDLTKKAGISEEGGYIVVTSAHMIFTSNQSCVAISFSVIRRFSVVNEEKHIFKIEVGRRFQHGEGVLHFVTSHDDSWALYNFCNKTAQERVATF